MAGVGKTTLAVHAAHRLRRQHRLDTVLWVNLRGYAADAPPADPAAVLEGFLRRLGMSPDRIRLLDTPSRAREFRSRLSGRRTLVVLDNAVDEDQVRHLLPGPRSALTLVTSRHAMSGLAEARRLRLDVFTPGEALQLLREMTGADRIDTDLATAGQIADSVGHLPLALGVVASRIRSSHGWTLADHLERLRGHRSQLKFDDRVELALGLSYEGLAEDCRRVFRLLSLHPGQDTDAYAAAALAGSGLETTRRHLGTLLAANLLRRPAPGRYEFHDLVRIYATGRAHDEDPGQARRAAFTRLVEHYWDTAARAMDRYAPHEAPHGRPAGTAGGADPARAGAAGDTIAPGGGAARGGESLDGGVRGEGARDGGAPGGAQRRAGAAGDPPTAHDPDARGPATRDPAPAPVPAAAPVPSAAAAADARGLLPEQGAPAPVLPDRSAATAWLAAEWAGLIATAASAADHGDPRHAGRLSAILFRYLDTCGHYKEAEVLHTHGARTPDPDDRAWALTNLGLTYWRLGRCPDTLDALGRALEQYRVIGDRIGECRSLGCIGEVHQFLGHRAETGEHFTAALATARAVADAHGSSAAGPARTGRRAVLYEPLGRYEKVYEQPEQIIALGLELLAGPARCRAGSSGPPSARGRPPG
ncbi:NB-ARC domain-containing protein [Streptomyces sp. NPDC048845]|uniref:NB-ARC domain-containing protein n=1 Tax=Streptomyces sp. NPDC048845 TaxID=3155390 RepID=UPI003429535D